jgi:hypothetical protein
LTIDKPVIGSTPLLAEIGNFLTQGDKLKQKELGIAK